MDYDIVTKIKRIRRYYQGEDIPRHIDIIISFIEHLPEYEVLRALQGTPDKKELKEKYDSFIGSFFLDTNENSLRAELTMAYRSVFRNNQRLYFKNN